jgi:hypothetical protein
LYNRTRLALAALSLLAGLKDGGLETLAHCFAQQGR